MPDGLILPAYYSVPEHVRTYGGIVAEHAEGCGLVLDGEQRLKLDAINAVDADDKLVALEVADIEGRQNGKTRTYIAQALADLFIFDEMLVVWTAHLFTTTKEAFFDVKALIDNTDDLIRRVDYIHEAQNDLSIKLKSGARMLFKARVKTGGRGLSANKLFLDEAWALSGAEIGSLLPTMSARKNPQIRYASSAGMLQSSFLRSLRKRGRAGNDPSLAYIEYASEVGGCAHDDCSHHYGVPGCVLDDEDRWQQANHTLGRRISHEFVRNERRTLPVVEFARERMGWWEDPLTEDDGVSEEDWAECKRSAELASPATLAVKINDDRSRSYIAAASGDVVRIVHEQAGTGGLVEKLVELNAGRPVAIDQYGQTGSLVTSLEKAGVELFLITASQLAQATGDLRDAITGHTLKHSDQPTLNAAVLGAAIGAMGRGASKWVPRSAMSEIAPLEAVTVARFVDAAYSTVEFDIHSLVAWR